jgi:hypothetical protein
LEKGGASCGRSGGGGEAMGTAKRRQPQSKHGQYGRCHCSDRAADGWAPAVTDFFPIYSKLAQIQKSKWVHYLAPKIPNVCMKRASNIGNILLNCANFKFQTEMKLKIL